MILMRKYLKTEEKRKRKERKKGITGLKENSKTALSAFKGNELFPLRYWFHQPHKGVKEVDINIPGMQIV